MSSKESKRQEKMMSQLFRGKEILKPLDTGWIDNFVGCIREFSANIFFYKKNGNTIMLDAGFNYDRLEEKMKWLGIAPESVSHIFLTHLDEDRIELLEKDSPVRFPDAKTYLGSLEQQYIAGLIRRKTFSGVIKLPTPELQKQPYLLKDGDSVDIGDIHVEAMLVPGHTWGHMVYLVDEKYLFTGDTVWLGPDGGRSYVNVLAEDNKLAMESLENLKQRLKERELKPWVITAHTGWTSDFQFAFSHIDEVCNAMKKQKPHDPDAPADPYDESKDIERKARVDKLPECKKIRS